MKSGIGLILLSLVGCAPQSVQLTNVLEAPKIGSLTELSVPALQQRSYGSVPKLISVNDEACVKPNSSRSLPQHSKNYQSYMVEFSSDGIKQYGRITLPNEPSSESGYPVVLFLHGWVGMENAPKYSIGCDPASMYAELTDGFARAGFAVVSPGYRGHGAVDNLPAEGIEYLEAYDQGAGLSTTFYAIDSLNFVAGLKSAGTLTFSGRDIDLDFSKFNLVGHSQGGDVGLTYLAVTSASENMHLAPQQAALWAGAFVDRTTMLTELFPVENTAQAFLSGDGSWTGTAIGQNGEVNPNFVFGYPADYIGDPNPSGWDDWQKESWSFPTVESAVLNRTSKMYSDLSTYVGDVENPDFIVSVLPDGGVSILHDEAIKKGLDQIGGYNFAEHITQPLSLHISDQDFYSQPKWNMDLCNRVNAGGGRCKVHIYPHNTHGMRASSQWFSPEGTLDGYPLMMSRYVSQFGQVERGSTTLGNGE
ncbi:MAG: alpha/beta hydrolase [Maricaulaceae bacterium]